MQIDMIPVRLIQESFPELAVKLFKVQSMTHMNDVPRIARRHLHQRGGNGFAIRWTLCMGR